ncbi:MULTISPECIES: hypothetical protein [Aeromonas]|uniref:hypothetical protein n=1 Tax=Aeromonas TaxID=642 RepID=UPI00051C77AD|nr:MULTISPECIES: hypothetical protein [Aeromonas]MCH7370655.1 hypothetical protein [Aeromonas sp. MR16]
MKIAILLLGLTFSTGLLAANPDRATHQAGLDRACINARQQQTGQDRQQLIDACVRAGGKATRCQQQYASVGQRTGNERPYVSPLAPCQQAEAYRKSDRQ